MLANLHLKILNENEKKFTENFVALAYFRIPEFRSKLLDCLKLSMAKGQTEIPEWRGAEWNLEVNENDIKNKYILQLFDWE